MIALMLALLALGATPRDEFGEQLARLGAPQAAVRAAAERWLQAHLVLERYADLVEAALGGDAEIRGRLVRVLSSDARHLALALALYAEKDAALSALGREAVRASVARADPRLGEPGLREGIEPLLRRAASASPPLALRLDARLSLAQVVEQLELVGELPIGLTLDPRVAARALRRDELLPSGPWNEVLWKLARSVGVEIECHGLVRERARENPMGVFLRLTGEPGATRTGVDLVSEWLFALAGQGDEPTRTLAARNLAASGFAPGLAWMEQLVSRRPDVAARAGLLQAAATGRVAAALTSPEILDPLLAEAEAEGGPRSARILCGLARAGCFDARGSALVVHLLAGFAQASPRARWTRLFLLERNACTAPEVEALVRALLADPATPPPLRLEALHVLLAQGTPAPLAPPRVEGLAELVRLARDAHEAERLGRLLLPLGLEPPYRDPSAIPPDWDAQERLGLLQLWLWHGESEPAAAHVGAWLGGATGEAVARAETLAEALRPWRARGGCPLLERVLRRAQELVPAASRVVARLRLLLGVVPGSAVPALLELLGGNQPILVGAQADPALAGALAGYPEPLEVEARAKEALLSQLDAALKENRGLEACAALIDALERALGGLYAAGRDEQASSLSRDVRRLLGRSEKAPVARGMEARGWPPGQPGEVRDLARLLARFEVPASL